MSKITGIYKIKSPTNAVYIGQSRDVFKRKEDYAKIRCKAQTIIYNSLLAHGFNNHVFEVVCELPADVDQLTLDAYEIMYWQQHIDCGFKMMNIKEPGSRGRCSESTKKKMSESSKKENLSMETRRKLSESSKRENLSADTLIRMSIANKNKIVTEATRKKISESHKGKVYSAETLEKMSKAKKGKPGHLQSKETKKKIADSHTGKKHSQETILLLSKINIGRKVHREWI